MAFFVKSRASGEAELNGVCLCAGGTARRPTADMSSAPLGLVAVAADAFIWTLSQKI